MGSFFDCYGSLFVAMNSFFQSLKSQTNIPEGFEVVRLLLLFLFMDIPYLIFCCFDDFHRSTLIDHKEVNIFVVFSHFVM